MGPCFFSSPRSGDCAELIDPDVVAAIREGREPNSSLAQCLPAMHVMDMVEKQFKS